jgi:competence protein ComEA
MGGHDVEVDELKLMIVSDSLRGALKSMLCVLASMACAAAFSANAADATPAQPPPGHPAIAHKEATRSWPVKRIDINKASRTELKTLPGIGDAEADKIVARRPFLTKADLVTQNVLPEGIYVSIKNRIVASQSGKLPPKK